MKYINQTIFLIIFLVSYIGIVKGQAIFGRSVNNSSVVSFGYINNAQLDVSKIVEEKCSVSKVKKLGEKSIEIKVEPSLELQAEKILEMVQHSFETTKDILSIETNEMESLKIFVLDGEIPNQGYRYQLSATNTFQMVLFLPEIEKTLDCENDYSQFCENIFGRLSHELTHPLVDSDVRWFEESICNLVREEVEGEIIGIKLTELYYLKVFVNNPKFMKSLLKWKNLTNKDFNNLINPANQYIESIKYEASFFLLGKAIREAQISYLEDDLKYVLIRAVVHERRKTGKTLSSQMIEDLLRKFKINPFQVKPMPNEEIAKINKLVENDIIKGKVNYSDIVAYLLKTQLSEKSLATLLNDVIKEKNIISAKILLNQRNQKLLNQVINQYLIENNSKPLNLQNIRQEIKKLGKSKDTFLTDLF